MRKILKSTATIALLCAMTFLGGEWPEDTPMKKVISYNGGAFAIVAVCGLYLYRDEKKGGARK